VGHKNVVGLVWLVDLFRWAHRSMGLGRNSWVSHLKGESDQYRPKPPWKGGRTPSLAHHCRGYISDDNICILSGEACNTSVELLRYLDI
jgi:hypothetical protein